MTQSESSATTPPEVVDPDVPMMRAYRTLRHRGSEIDEVERAEFIQTLITGRNSGWAWFALRDLSDLCSVNELRRLAQIVVKGGDGLMMIWVLQDSPQLPSSIRHELVEGVVKTRDTGWADYALRYVDGLNDDQRGRLQRVSFGLDPADRTSEFAASAA